MLCLIQAADVTASESILESIFFLFLALALLTGWWMYKHPHHAAGSIRSGAKETVHWSFSWLMVIVIAVFSAASSGFWIRLYDTTFRKAAAPDNFPSAGWMSWDWELFAGVAAIVVLTSSEYFVPDFMKTSVYGWHQKATYFLSAAAKLFVLLVIIPGVFVFFGVMAVKWVPAWPIWIRYWLPIAAGITVFVLVLNRMFTLLGRPPEEHLRGTVVLTDQQAEQRAAELLGMNR